MFVVADPEEKTCHGILTVRKVFDIDNERMDLKRNLRKRRAPDASVSTVVNERKGRRFECGYCEYESRAQYITARHVARVHLKNIRPTKCDLCPFKTIYSANLKRHKERVHNSVNLRLRCESKSSGSGSKSSGSGSKSSGSKSGSTSLKSCAKSSSSSVVPLNYLLHWLILVFYFFVLLFFTSLFYFSLFTGLPCYFRNTNLQSIIDRSSYLTSTPENYLTRTVTSVSSKLSEMKQSKVVKRVILVAFGLGSLVVQW